MCRAGKKRKGRGFGTCILSEPLAKFMGAERAPRTEVHCHCCAYHEVPMALPGDCHPVLPLTPHSLFSVRSSQEKTWLNGYTCHILPLQRLMQRVMLCLFPLMRQAIADALDVSGTSESCMHVSDQAWFRINGVASRMHVDLWSTEGQHD